MSIPSASDSIAAGWSAVGRKADRARTSASATTLQRSGAVGRNYGEGPPAAASVEWGPAHPGPSGRLCSACSGRGVRGAGPVRAHSAGHPWPAGDGVGGTPYRHAPSRRSTISNPHFAPIRPGRPAKWSTVGAIAPHDVSKTLEQPAALEHCGGCEPPHPLFPAKCRARQPHCSKTPASPSVFARSGCSCYSHRHHLANKRRRPAPFLSVVVVPAPPPQPKRRADHPTRPPARSAGKRGASRQPNPPAPADSPTRRRQPTAQPAGAGRQPGPRPTYASRARSRASRDRRPIGAPARCAARVRRSFTRCSVG